ncbi:MAG: hypothetical protein F4X12_21370 [Acidobacteriia bacterium]|nr:hypothetical protein [Terriglobia bacterium]
MQDGALIGAQFDAAFDTDTDMKTGTIGLPVLSVNDPDTAANELRTHLIVTGSVAEDNEGMFSIGSLLGSGMATDEGPRYVAGAVETITKVRADVTSLLSIEIAASTLRSALEGQWDDLEMALDTVFGTDSDAATDPTSAVRTDAPRREDILDDIDDILDALASEDAFVAATAADGGGVFESQELGASAAMDTFNRAMWSATATMGATGATRYGTAFRKSAPNAREDLKKAEVGAFSYSTMANTVRTSQAAAVSLTGIASYTGGTEAVSGGGTAYSGTMDLQVRFAANTVSGVVKNLLDADGLPWQHNFADVERIVLSDARLLRNATFSSGAKTEGTVFFTADSGLLRPISGLTTTLKGILLGTGDNAGSQANGVWEINTSGSTNYLTGGFGVMHVGDASRPRPGGDAGGASNATLISTPTTTAAQYDDGTSRDAIDITPTVSVADGKLTVKVAKFGWQRGDSTTDPVQYVVTTVDPEDTPTNFNDDVAARATAEFDLEALAGKAIGAKTTVNGPKHVDSVRATLQAQRDQIATLQSLGTRTESTKSAEVAAWQIVQDAVQYQLFGGTKDPDGNAPDNAGDTGLFFQPDRSQLPNKLAGAYNEDEALGLIDRAIEALSNATTLFAALDPEGTGVFDRTVDIDGIQSDGTIGTTDGTIEADPDNDATTNDTEFGSPYITYDNGDRRWETIARGRTLGNFLGEREHQVVASLGTTDYTRFGIWYRLGTESAEREPSNQRGNHTAPDGGPGAFAYSPLDPTMAGNATNPAFPVGGSASYVGEAVAHMHTDVLTGTARVDVSWAAATALDLSVGGDAGNDGGAPDDVTSNAGTMSLTLADLADADGDPLTYTGIAGAPNQGHEIAEIVFSEMAIEVGLPGGRSGQLIVGAETEVPEAGELSTYTYGEGTVTVGTTLDASNVRYRLAAIGMDDQLPASGATASVGALFVGQGVDGPLGVIGTFTLSDSNVARVHADGTKVEDHQNVNQYTIRGGFGADSP